MLFPSFAIKEAQYLEAVPGWDSGVGSDCWPGLDMESGEVIGGEFASEGSGVLASEAREQSGCTCDDTQQPDHVKVGSSWCFIVTSSRSGHHRQAEGPRDLLHQAAD